jgi:hypothetical protein
MPAILRNILAAVVGLDLPAACIPMAWLGIVIGRRHKGPRGATP